MSDPGKKPSGEKGSGSRPTHRFRVLLNPWLALCSTLVWMGVIFWASAHTSDEIPPPPFPHADKVIHAGVYGLLGSLLFHTVGCFRKTWDYRAAWMALILGSLYGISDELHQTQVPGRTADTLDWMADTLGTSAGFFWRFLLVRLRSKQVPHES